ncbi:MAG TPA: M20/M25/M40 family metallo-hydrolase [Actinomycetota bacterium]|nr:M20/M25/M40 family metallo-hydrolase [Actinomycetota bacterium]
MTGIREFIEAHADEYVGWLTEACSIPSLAEKPEALTEMASWLQDKLEMLGFDVARLELPGAPDTFLAEAGGGDRTLLVYDHYDVQPVDPIELWDSQPFQPEIRDGKFFARGAADNKGDLIARLASLHAYRETKGNLPLRYKFLIEGEEEVGSKSFPALIARYGDRLKADGCIWEGMGIDHAGRPEFVFGAKGLAYIELWSRMLPDDQHSSLAVIAPSAAWRLIEALRTLRDAEGNILIDGFYDDVVPPSERDEEILASLPFEEEAERARLGIEDFVGNATGLDLVRRYFFEPTCNIAGLVSGFTIPGTEKTVLPKEAMAKIDLRLVPDQQPEEVTAKIRKHLEQRGFDDIEVLYLSGQPPVRSEIDAAVGAATLAAARKVFAEPAAVSPLMIGTGPMYPIAGTLGIPTVSPAGVCRPDSNIHAPNEHVLIDDFIDIVEYSATWIEEFAATTP